MSDPPQAGSRSATAIRHGLELAGWTAMDLWLATVGVGGNFRLRDIERIASGQAAASPAEHDMLAVAFNEHLVERGENLPVQMWDDLDDAS